MHAPPPPRDAPSTEGVVDGVPAREGMGLETVAIPPCVLELEVPPTWRRGQLVRVESPCGTLTVRPTGAEVRPGRRTHIRLSPKPEFRIEAPRRGSTRLLSCPSSAHSELESSHSLLDHPLGEQDFGAPGCTTSLQVCVDRGKQLFPQGNTETSGDGFPEITRSQVVQRGPPHREACDHISQFVSPFQQTKAGCHQRGQDCDTAWTEAGHQRAHSRDTHNMHTEHDFPIGGAIMDSLPKPPFHHYHCSSLFFCNCVSSCFLV